MMKYLIVTTLLVAVAVFPLSALSAADGDLSVELANVSQNALLSVPKAEEVAEIACPIFVQAFGENAHAYSNATFSARTAEESFTAKAVQNVGFAGYVLETRKPVVYFDENGNQIPAECLSVVNVTDTIQLDWSWVSGNNMLSVSDYPLTVAEAADWLYYNDYLIFACYPDEFYTGNGYEYAYSVSDKELLAPPRKPNEWRSLSLGFYIRTAHLNRNCD